MRIANIARALWQPLTSFVPIRLWLLVAFTTLFATALYWLSPGAERFEHWFGLSTPLLPAAWSHALSWLSRYLPDAAWAALVACAARDLFRSLQIRLPRLLIVPLAAGWELAQGLSLAPGYFDSVDLLLSVLVAGIVLLVPAKGERFCGNQSDL